MSVGDWFTKNRCEISLWDRERDRCLRRSVALGSHTCALWSSQLAIGAIEAMTITRSADTEYATILFSKHHCSVEQEVKHLTLGLLETFSVKSVLVVGASD